MTFLPEEVAREVIRGATARALGSTASLVIALGLAATCAAWGWQDSSGAVRAAASAHSVGVDSFSIRATAQRPIDSARCDELRTVEGVEGAGAVLRSRTAHPAQDASYTAPIVTATPGYAAVAFPGLRPAGGSVVAGADAAKRLRLAAGGSIQLVTSDSAAQSFSLTATAPSSAMVPGLDDAVVVASAERGTVSECVVTARLGSRAAVEAILRDWFPTKDVSIVDLRRADGLALDPDSALRNRVSALGPLAAGGMLLLFGIISAWTRRSEFGLYRMLGMRWTWVLVYCLVEAGLTVWLPVAGGFLAFASFAAFSGDSIDGVVASAMIRDFVTLGAVVSVLPLCSTAAVMRFNPIDISKGR